MSPGVDLRGVQYGRYQGDTALSIEAELRHQFTPRWAGVVFGGYGQTSAENSRIYESRDNIWTYGVGIRYRISRRYGIDFGVDVARGPGGTVFYIQFGHAWARTMD
jgi:hemolysin activation/secretion protein